jgi:hypothetical protein
MSVARVALASLVPQVGVETPAGSFLASFEAVAVS